MLEKLKKQIFDPSSLCPPPGSRFGQTDISLCGRMLLEIDGCYGLTEYSACKISVRIKEGILSVLGKELSLKTYSGARIAVGGSSEEIRFEEAPKGESL